MLAQATCQQFLPPEHGTAKTVHIDGHEIAGQHDRPHQLAAEVGPATGCAAHEEYGIDDPEIGLGCSKGHEETGYHSDYETDQFEYKSPGI